MRPGIPFHVYQPGAAQVPGLVIFGEDDPFLARPSDIVTVRRNKITLCGWHSIEAGQVAAPSERLRIRDSKTAGIFLVNVHGALVRGNTFESVKQASFSTSSDTRKSVQCSVRSDGYLSVGAKCPVKLGIKKTNLRLRFEVIR